VRVIDGQALGRAVKEKAGNVTRALVDFSADSLEDKLNGAINASLARVQDPWQPRALARASNRIVKGIVKEISGKIRMAEDLHLEDTSSKIRIKERTKSSEVGNWPQPTHLRSRPFFRLRAELLYSLMAGDKSVWWSVRQPLCLLFTVLSLCPYGVCLIPFTLVFMLMDWSDEYQMANFICTMKTVTFIQRFGMMIAGTGQLYFTVTSLSCNSSGPGVTDFEQLAILALVPQQLLAWLAFVHYSRLRSARLLLQHRKASDKTKSERGLRFYEKSLLVPVETPDRDAKGLLVVRVLSAEGLLVADPRGTSDPFASLSLGGTKRRTRTIWRTLAPQWNESLGFEGVLGKLVAAGPLLVKVWDFDVTSANDFLGEVEVELEPLLLNPSMTITDMPLSRGDGSVCLELIWKVFAASETTLRPIVPSQLPIAQSAVGNLHVLIQSGSHLVARDRGGSSDPYASVIIAGRQLRTASIKKTLEPVWNEVLLFKGVSAAQLDTEVLKIKVFDDDQLSRDDFMGDHQTTLAEVRKKGTLSVIDGSLEGARTGSVTYTVTWEPSTGDAVDGDHDVEKPVTSKKLTPLDCTRSGDLTVKIVCGTELVSKDRDGLSDPFVTTCLGHARQRTRKVRDSLDPVWDETMHFEGVLEELVERGPLLLTVWDHDTFSLNDFLGELEVPLEPLLQRSELNIKNATLAGVSHGSITVSVEWLPFTLEHPEVTLWCGATLSVFQNARPPNDAPLRAVLLWDAVFLILFFVISSADLMVRIHGISEWRQAIADLLPLWSHIFTFSTDPIERRLLWYTSTYGIAFGTAPFLFFKLPVLGDALLRLLPTGYDRSGALRLEMTSAEMLMKYEIEQRNRGLRRRRSTVSSRRGSVDSAVLV